MSRALIDQPVRRIGWSSISSAILFGMALLGLGLLESQISIFSLDPHWPDARSFPATALALLAGATLLRIILNLFRTNPSLGLGSDFIRVVVLFVWNSLALVSIPLTGFFVGAVLIASTTSFAIGERRLKSSLVLAVLVAIVIFFGAKYGLKIPLP